jgi:ATP/maltotriose-dependent transcriptional regulator MalT
MQGRLDDALVQITTALSIMQGNYGPVHSDVAYEHELFGDVLADKGDLAGAREQYQRAVDTYAQLVGPNRGDTLFATIGLSTIYVRLGQCDEARRLLIPTVAGLEASGSEYGVAEALVPLAQCDLERGDAADALPRLQRVVACYERQGTAVAALGAARFALARALLATGAGTTRAVSVARRAKQELARSGHPGARDLERLRAWLGRLE